MRNFERRPRTFGDILFRLLLVLLAALLLLALQVTGYLQPIKGSVTQLTSPAQLASNSFSETIADLVDFVLDFGTIRQQLQTLQEENARLKTEVADKIELERENQELKQTLSFARARPGLELRGAQVLARVIGQESSNFLRYITIDLGSRQGIKVGMPALTAQGLVGRISEVRESTSDVLLIQNINSYVPVYLQTSLLNGVLTATPAGELLMDYIPQGTGFSRNELALTSGLGGTFPKGIPVGIVTEQSGSDNQVLQRATIAPLVNVDRLELVAIVTNFEVDPDLVSPELPSGAQPTVSPTPTGPTPAATPTASGGATQP
ncbi:MAG: rod shape-determining protein MreC [Caldilineaceae bacterium]